MSALPKTWPELIAYVINSKNRTANATKLVRQPLLALVVLAAIIAALVVLASGKASLLQLGVGGGGAAAATAAVSWLKHRWRRKSGSVEQPVRAQAGDQDDGGSDDDAEPAEDGAEQKGGARGEDTGRAVVESA